MNILLISPAMKNYRRTSELPMALISIATFLTQKGHCVKVIDRLVKVTNVEKIIEDFRPDFVGLTLMYVKTIDDARKCAEVARNHGAKTVFGGHLASDSAELLLKEDYVDFVIMGEGEYAWHELLTAYQNGDEYSSIKGLAYKNDGRIIINERREFCDLADLPPMDFGFVNPPDYFQTYNYCKKQVHLYTSKGCPGRCAFCFNAHFHQSVHRKRPIEHVIEEIRCMVNEYGADGIYFEDEILRTNSNDIAEVCQAFQASGINFVWGCKMRFGILKPEDYVLMYESGCRWIFAGVETASKDMCSMIHKGIQLDVARSDIANCAKAGILPVSSFIVGLPDENTEDLKETVQFAKSIKESVIFCGYFVLFYGSELYDKLLAEGKIPPPKTIDDLKEYPIIDDYFKANYSKVPARDLKVIRAYLLWWSFITPPPSKDESGYSLMKKAWTESFKTASRLGLIGFIAEVYSAVFVASSFGFNLFCFPSVKKKYGLTLSRN